MSITVLESRQPLADRPAIGTLKYEKSWKDIAARLGEVPCPLPTYVSERVPLPLLQEMSGSIVCSKVFGREVTGGQIVSGEVLGRDATGIGLQPNEGDKDIKGVLVMPGTGVMGAYVSIKNIWDLHHPHERLANLSFDVGADSVLVALTQAIQGRRIGREKIEYTVCMSYAPLDEGELEVACALGGAVTREETLLVSPNRS